MAALLTLIDVSFSRGNQTLFEHISLTINPGDRIGFAGHNGSGKSTLLSLISGTEQPDDGEVRIPNGQRVSLVEQFVPKHLSDLSLIDATLDALSPELRFVQRYRAEQLLQELGFANAQTELPLSRLSGGQQNLALLARAILREPELLLMDEPGNHMDVIALAYLQHFLLSNQALPFLMISHDRELLNKCCSRTVFLRDQTLYPFDLPFDAAAQALAERDLQAAKARQAEEKEIKRLESSVKRLAHWGKTFDNEDLARKAKSMQKRVQRLKQEQTSVSKGSGLELQLQTESLQAKSLLTIENLAVNTLDGQRKLLHVDFQYIRPGDRIALLGKNGVGKSTTIHRLVEAIKEPDESIRYNPNTKIGFYDQELEQFACATNRFDWLRERTDVTDDRIKHVLLKNGIPFVQFEQSVEKLSGGERARLMFMVFDLNKPNFLVLDEPTNHIDIAGREQLEQQLIESKTTLLLTSHDRRFIEHVANRWWWINDQQLIELGGLDEFYAVVEQDTLAQHSSNCDEQSVEYSKSNLSMTEDEKLARIDELETLLKNDQERKPKFQKVERQKEWAQELERLWAELN